MKRFAVQINDGDETPVKKWKDELTKLQQTHRVTGFPINMPYTSMKAILEAVYATQVHTIPTSNVEYGLAVYVHAYPNNILSVWIYIATLIKKE